MRCISPYIDHYSCCKRQ